MSRRSFEIPTRDTDRVGDKITLTIEAWVTKIESDLVDAGTPDEPELRLPSDRWTTLEIDRVERSAA